MYLQKTSLLFTKKVIKSHNNAFQGTGYQRGFLKFSLSNLLSGFIQVGCCKTASPWMRSLHCPAHKLANWFCIYNFPKITAKNHRAIANGCSLIVRVAFLFYKWLLPSAENVLRANLWRLHSLNIAKTCHKLAIAFNQLLSGSCPWEKLAKLLLQSAQLQNEIFSWIQLGC
jgi:hypothetical protein